MNAGDNNKPSATRTTDAIALVARVNLLPETAWLAQAGRRRLWRWAGVVATLGAVGVFAWLWGGSRGFEIDKVRSMLGEELVRTRQEQKLSVALAARAEVQRTRQAVLETMRAGESWAARLAELAAAVPDGIVLKRIQVVSTKTPTPARGVEEASPAGPAKVEIRIDGYATDHLVLAALLHRLEEGGTYREVRLVRSAAAEQHASGCLDFGLVCQR